MQWQDDLRELDARLAAGRMSAGEHRRRRDEVLAEASSTTGRIPGSAFQSAVPPQPGWPPPNDVPQALPVPQPHFDGEAVFTTATPQRGPGRLVVVAVVAAIAVGAAVWWAVSRGDKPEAAAPVAVSPAAELVVKLPALPGTVVSQPAVLPATLGPQLGLYARGVAPEDSSGLVNTATADGPRSLVVNVLDNGAGQDRTAQALGYAKASGWVVAPAPEGTSGVEVVRTVHPTVQLYRGIYRSTRWTVLVTATGAADDEGFRAYFESVLDRTRATLPVG
ncbi:hypothetical protein [Actinokineospora sp. NBRC 105648]|uniref:hypothetical protein n=1 Tax=Actinokineospora sp. NBRC 105648 TaxID=3032206 RepID=UPI0024A14C7E|nr:hypothetical protein [Actinokineospora sp. NBRC 105648]GLZ41272.1 hypothetical protein Acsp05_48960 [Actinokineospora sp. NBRC 105648]